MDHMRAWLDPTTLTYHNSGPGYCWVDGQAAEWLDQREQFWLVVITSPIYIHAQRADDKCRATEDDAVRNYDHRQSEYIGRVFWNNPQSTATRRRHSLLAPTIFSLLWCSHQQTAPTQNRPGFPRVPSSLFRGVNHFHKANMPEHRHSDRTYQLDPASPNLLQQGGTYVPTGMATSLSAFYS